MGTSAEEDHMERIQNTSDGEPIVVTHRDKGTTLVEILISLVLLSTLIAALLGGVFTAISSSSTAFEGAKVETVLLNAADRVDRAGQLCDYEQYVDAAASAIDGANPWPASTITATVEKLVTNNGSASTDWAPTDCTSDPDVEPFDVQRITITASNPSGTITRTLTMVKSDVN